MKILDDSPKTQNYAPPLTRSVDWRDVNNGRNMDTYTFIAEYNGGTYIM